MRVLFVDGNDSIACANGYIDGNYFSQCEAPLTTENLTLLDSYQVDFTIEWEEKWYKKIDDVEVPTIVFSIPIEKIKGIYYNWIA